jgi:tetratricopeptide (TPR) repeat protein
MATRWALFSAVLLLGLTPAWADDDKGQADLDKAIELRVSANDVESLGKVIDLFEQALKKGLSEENAAFARQVLSSTLIDRGSMYAQALFARPPQSPDQLRQWSEFRKQAEGDLKRGVELDPKQPDAWQTLGRLQAAGGDRDGAISSLEEAVRLNEKLPQAKAQTLILLAELVQDVDRRAAYYDESVSLLPESADPLRVRGLFRYSLGKSQEAIDDFTKALEIAPNHPPTMQALALALSSLGKQDEAKDQLDNVIEIEPRSPGAYLQRARIFALRDDAKSAVEDLDDCLLLAPNNPDALILRSAMLDQLGESKKALSDVDKALSLVPGFLPALRMKAALVVKTDQVQETIDDLLESAQTHPDDISIDLQLAFLYTADNQPEKAIQAYSDVIERNDQLFDAFRGRGDLYLTNGKHSEAVADFESAYKLNASDSGLLNNYAWVLATSPEEAVRDGKRAVGMAEEACRLTEYKAAHILSTLAAAHAEAGDFKSAIEWSEKAVEAGAAEGDDELKSQLAKELESYKEGKPWRELLTGEEDESKPEKPASGLDGTAQKSPASNDG